MQQLTIDARMIHASGIGVYLQNLIPYLTRMYNTCLIGDPTLFSGYDWASAAAIIPSAAPIYSLKEQVELFRKVPKCELLWSPHYNIPLLPVAARKRLVTIHDVYHLAYRHTLSPPQKLYADLFLKSATSRSDKIITVSEFSRDEICRYTQSSAEDITVIHNGVDLGKFRALDKALAKQQLKVHFPDLPESFILYVGNVKPHKNLLTLLQAFSLLNQEADSSLGLVIVGKKEGFITGDEQLAAKLQEDNHIRNKVFFTGFVQEEHLPLIYNAASLFVFPSFYEGFGLPPLEAMASGCAVLASDAASIPEICGEAAMYFNPSDAPALKQKLSYLLTDEDKRQKLIELGLKHVRKYSWQNAAEKHIAVIEELLHA